MRSGIRVYPGFSTVLDRQPQPGAGLTLEVQPSLATPMKPKTPLTLTLTIALSFLLTSGVGSTGAQAATTAAVQEKQRFGKLVPLSATFDDSNTLRGHLEVRGKRVAFRSRTARRSGNLASGVWHSPRRISGRATFAATSKVNSLRALTTSSAEAGFKLATATSAPRRKLGGSLKTKLAKLPGPQLQTYVSSSHVQQAAAAESGDCTCHEARRLVDQKRYADAAIAYEKYANKLEKTFNKKNGDYANALAWQGYSLDMDGRKAEAKKVLEKARLVYKENAEPADDTLEWINDQLAEYK